MDGSSSVSVKVEWAIDSISKDSGSGRVLLRYRESISERVEFEFLGELNEGRFEEGCSNLEISWERYFILSAYSALRFFNSVACETYFYESSSSWRALL